MRIAAFTLLKKKTLQKLPCTSRPRMQEKLPTQTVHEKCVKIAEPDWEKNHKICRNPEHARRNTDRSSEKIPEITSCSRSAQVIDAWKNHAVGPKKNETKQENAKSQHQKKSASLKRKCVLVSFIHAKSANNAHEKSRYVQTWKLCCKTQNRGPKKITENNKTSRQKPDAHELHRNKLAKIQLQEYPRIVETSPWISALKTNTTL